METEGFIKKDKKRGERRHQKKVVKQRTREKIKQRYDDDSWVTDRVIGIESKTPKRCSSICCGNPRRHLKELSLQEIQDQYNIKGQLEELFNEE